MRQVINISDMFHDDSFEGFNFVLASQDDSFGVLPDHEVIKAYRKEIKARISQGEMYLAVDIESEGENILEIQWG